VSQCLEAAIGGASWAIGHFDYCPSQYDPATGYGLDYSAAYEATVTASLANMLGGAVATFPFVIDTSRQRGAGGGRQVACRRIQEAEAHERADGEGDA
jgi:hypothetical protein